MRRAALLILPLAVVGLWLGCRLGAQAAAPLPAEYVELQRVNWRAATVVFSRRKLRAEFAIWERRGDRFERIALDERLAGSLYFLHALVSGDAAYVIAYNTAETIPSGRSRADYKDGIDLYRLDRRPDGRAELREIYRMLPVGGIDSVFYDAPIKGGLASCAEFGCLLFDADPPRVIKPSAWAGRELVELAGDGTRAFGLLQLAPDDRLDPLPAGDAAVHFVCSIAADSSCEALPPEVPAELSVADGQWRIRYAEGRDARITVLLRDLERMPRQRYLFDNNLEGRVAWGQVYELEAMVDILSAGDPMSPALAAHARQRLSEALAGLVALSRTDAWFWTKRYSVARQPLVSIVHLGRISSVVERARTLARIEGLAELSRSLIEELASLERTIERRDGRTLAIKRGAPFWIDGSLVPWNFQSAWVEAMARSGRDKAAIAGMVALMIEQERFAELPETWRYAWGPLHDGWTRADDVSTNTPDWEGNKTRDIGGMAHVSYRTMDARALLAAHRLMRVPLPTGFVDHVQRLVRSGRLRPSISPELIQLGKRPQLDSAIARMSSRSGRPVQLQDQVWALLLAPATP